jgi:hypothetical protein
MIAVVRGNITNLRVNFAGSLTSHQIARRRGNLGYRLVNKSQGDAGSANVIAPINPTNLLNRVRKTPSTHLGNRPPATKPP